MFDIWNREEPLASEQYRKPNYCTREHGVKDGWCVIYCSSNDIWYPNEEDAFRRSFVEGDYYEWKNVGCDRAAKEIFVRDIFVVKAWNTPSIPALLRLVIDKKSYAIFVHLISSQCLNRQIPV